MGSQFVDLDADGQLDYLTATFDGSPHVARGTERGFAAPEPLLDGQGRRILISSIWDYEQEAHRDDGRAMPDGQARDERCISALAYDWDADGDLDLLLGSYENGHLYRQMNAGNRQKPEYSGLNTPVEAGGVPFALPAKMTAPVLVDWDGDGDLDLVTGSFGDDYGHELEGGGVYLALDEGERGSQRFGALQTLIEPSRKGASEPTRPDAGLYPAVIDWDGDGDLDLLVGGYSMWTPVPPKLDERGRARIQELKSRQAELNAQQEALEAEFDAAVKAALGDLDPEDPAAEAKLEPVQERFSPRFAEVQRSLQSVTDELDELTGAPRRKSYVWLYERL